MSKFEKDIGVLIILSLVIAAFSVGWHFLKHGGWR